MAFDKFMSILSPIYDQCCPLKTATKKKNQPRKPWITEEILEMMKKRDQLFSDYLNCESDDSWEEYRKARNRVNSARRAAMREYFGEKLK